MKRDVLRKIAPVVSLFILVACTSGFSFDCPISNAETKYADAKEVLGNLADLIETFVKSMDQADNAESIAKALDGFAEAMKELLPRFNEIREKYPELGNEDTHPEELKPLLQRLDKDFQAMMKSYGKVNEHLEDPAVKAADEKYKEVMAGLR